MVIGIYSNFFQIIMLSAYPEAFLCVCDPWRLWLAVAEKIILELIHTRIGEHEGRVIFHNNRGRRDNLMSSGTKEIQELLSYVCTRHHDRVIRGVDF
jgi:hypothetical protein